MTDRREHMPPIHVSEVGGAASMTDRREHMPPIHVLEGEVRRP